MGRPRRAGAGAFAPRLVALLLAAHPGPALAVTALATLLAWTRGAGPATTALVALAFGLGQLSIGWCNDWWDAERDATAGRPDKPAASGRVSRTLVGRSAAVAAVATVPASLALGWRAGVAHLLAVASAWSYNLWLKSTAWSWLPFAVSFGLLPAVVTLALEPPVAPAAWLVGAGALLGVGAHLVNVLPDLDDDAATGVHGAAHRLGRRRTALLAPVVLLAAVLLVLLGPPGPPSAGAWLALAVAAVAAAVAAWSAVHPLGPVRAARLVPLAATAVVALVAVVLLLATES